MTIYVLYADLDSPQRECVLIALRALLLLFGAWSRLVSPLMYDCGSGPQTITHFLHDSFRDFLRAERSPKTDAPAVTYIFANFNQFKNILKYHLFLFFAHSSFCLFHCLSLVRTNTHCGNIGVNVSARHLSFNSPPRVCFLLK